MSKLEVQLKEAIRDIPDFPKPGILFRDITPILSSPALCESVIQGFKERIAHLEIDAIAGVESRGFLFGMPLAMAMGVPFITVRKKGKLPYTTVNHSYDLEYGSAEIEMHVDEVNPGMKVMVHDDLLATGGTAGATAELIKSQGGIVNCFTFLVELSDLKGVEKLSTEQVEVISLVTY